MKKDEVKVAEKGKNYHVKFRENRFFELYVGRERYEFAPFGENILPEQVVEHDDFKQMRDLFCVVEGK